MTGKRITKILSIFFAVLFIVQLLPLTTFAEEYNEEQARIEYLRSTLSDYLFSVIDTENTVEIIKPEAYVSYNNPYSTRLTVLTLDGETVFYDFSEDIAYFDENDELRYVDISEDETTGITYTVMLDRENPVDGNELQPEAITTVLIENSVVSSELPYAFVSGDILEIRRFLPQRIAVIQYKVGENGEWTEYTAPVRLICTVPTEIYCRAVITDGEILTGNSVIMQPNVGVYTDEKDDVGNGDFMLPSGFIRTYSSLSDQWFFAFNANISVRAEGNALCLTDFYGNKQYYLISESDPNYYYAINGDRIEKISGSITIGEDSASFLYALTYGASTVYFSSDGKIAGVVDENQRVVYQWTDDLLTIKDNHSRIYTVEFTGGKPTKITDCTGNSTVYGYTSGKLTQISSSVAETQQNLYSDNGKMTYNQGEHLAYVSDGRIARITQPNGSFVKYTYDDIYENGTAPGRVLVEDSRGVSLYVNYADGFNVGERPDETDDTAVYDPEHISSVIGSSTVNPIAYVIEEVEAYETEETPLLVELDGNNSIFYEYNANGQVTNEVITSGSDYDSFSEAEIGASEKTAYTYDGDKLTSITEFVKIGDLWGYRTKTEYRYNSEGAQTQYRDYVFGDGDWQLQYQEEYTYDSYGNISETVSADYSEETASYTTERNEYNALNTVIASYRYSGIELKSNTQYTYDARGNMTGHISDGQTLSLAYDESNNIISYTSSDSSVSAFITYTNGNLTSVTDGDNHTQQYIYDDFGNLTTQIFDIYTLSYNTLGSLVSAKVNGNDLVSYTFTGGKQNMTGAGFANGQSITYGYNEDGMLSYTKLGDKVKYSYSYTVDDENNIISTVISDMESGLSKTIAENQTSVYAVKFSNEASPIIGGMEVNSVDLESPRSPGIRPLYSVKDEFLEETDENSFNGKVYTFGNLIFTLVSEENRDIFLMNNSGSVFVKTSSYDDNYNLAHTGIDGVLSSTYTYTENNLVSKLSHALKEISLDYEYTYDKQGNILSENDTSYTYDENSQLIAAENENTKWAYTYDGRGNILSKTEYEVSLDNEGEKVYTVTNTDTFTYSNTDWQDELTARNGQSIVYDAAGNPTSYLGHTLTWTMGRRLASFDGITYTYNEDGIRTSKTANGVTTRYYLDGANIIAQTDGNNAIYFRYDSNEELIGLTYNGNDYFYVKNQMKDIMGIVDAAGNLVASYTYDPWGGVISITGSNIALANANPFRYRSYYYDSEIGMYYLQSRYYDTEICRFINADEVKYLSITENLFIYCYDNPINFIDEQGNLAATLTSAATALGVSSTTLLIAATFLIASVAVLTQGRQILSLTEAIAILIQEVYLTISSTIASTKTITLSDVKAKLPSKTAKVYHPAYVDKNDNLVRIDYVKYTFTQAISALGFSGAYNLTQRFSFTSKTNSKAKTLIRDKAGNSLKGEKYWGIYTFSQEYARALAVVFGCSEAPEVHHSGYYGHYHNGGTHYFHIWFGGPVYY